MPNLSNAKLNAIAVLISPEFHRQITPEEVNSALSVLSGKTTINEVAKIMGVTVGTMRNAFSKSGIKAIGYSGIKAQYSKSEICQKLPDYAQRMQTLTTFDE